MVESPFMVTLYFRGNNLKPEIVTEQLRHISDGDTMQRRAAVWTARPGIY